MKKIYFIIFAVLFVALVVGILLYKNQNRINIYSTNGTSILVGPNTKESDTINQTVSNMANATSTESCKQYKGNGDFSCVTNLAVKNKDPKLCAYFIENAVEKPYLMENSCLGTYIQASQDFSACSLMSNDPSGDWWKERYCK